MEMEEWKLQRLDGDDLVEEVENEVLFEIKKAFDPNKVTEIEYLDENDFLKMTQLLNTQQFTFLGQKI